MKVLIDSSIKAIFIIIYNSFQLLALRSDFIILIHSALANNIPRCSGRHGCNTYFDRSKGLANIMISKYKHNSLLNIKRTSLCMLFLVMGKTSAFPLDCVFTLPCRFAFPVYGNYGNIWGTTWNTLSAFSALASCFLILNLMAKES